MKYRKLFFLSLPFSILGLGKIIRHHHECGWHHFHRRRFNGYGGHVIKFIAWHLGLSPEQKLKMEELHGRMKTEFKPFAEKKSEMHRILTQEFRKEQFETDQLGGQFTTEMLDKGHDLLLKGIREFHDILTPVQREKVASHFERRHCC